jgi:hypothetical protein
MYYENEGWTLVKNISLSAVAFPAFIVLPCVESKEEEKFKLFIFGGLELD